MTITLQAVNELIASLESAGELSIKETKVMALAKAYQHLAAENVAIREQSEEVYAAGYNHGHLNTVDGIAYAGCVKDDFYSLALQVMAEVETPATDRIVAEAEARGVEKAIAHLEKKFSNIGVQIMNLQWLADSLRKGASE
ncbi:hypothetical protein L6M70_09190 [Klebsiella pneumoniae]|uniref:hypothetical protein n=1 Tax=Klebsiella pneumoniae complex TaxID=3390273 RepID=UPI001644ED46|nr:hypothetical protein [Klebsiella pneumoniae]HBQ4450799.1 hypothetical protein [Klebsiella pneumoniae subsp. pneumoniae]MBC4100654.1 hypothetical protein [Klebsiella pneumoniae]MCL3216306.1 hypothetical protein [Klebsiella pneumoniae]MCL3436009.1 hypothetical protein [Klebsiella pneumoniae]MCL3457194.1 hypothetical protein [Klebsiella pneumoniae]